MNFYLNKYGFQNPTIKPFPNKKLGICIVIPCYNETELILSLEALYSCDRPKVPVEIITVINAGITTNETIKAENRKTYKKAVEWSKNKNTPNFQFHFILEEALPKKHAGVGLARKIGMDEAVHRFELVKTDGIIVCFDADSLCETNYLKEIENHFLQYPKTHGCSIHFEHPISGNKFSAAIYTGIINYELHLRYYNQALKFAKLPYAFHTVGSSMAVRSSAYQKQGGMNKRKAGEDFYFIHKIIALGNFTEIKTTKVIPSPRISDRVPFGTGKAIGDWIEKGEEVYKTYAFECFILLKAFVERISDFSTIDLHSIAFDINKNQKKQLIDFLETQKFASAIAEISKNSKGEKAFEKRFFRWFDAFKVLKFIHYLRDNGTRNLPIKEETNKLISNLFQAKTFESEVEQLSFLREIEKK